MNPMMICSRLRRPAPGASSCGFSCLFITCKMKVKIVVICK